MKIKQKALESPSESNHEDISESEGQHSKFEDKAEPRGMLMIEWPPTSNSIDF